MLVRLFMHLISRAGKSDDGGVRRALPEQESKAPQLVPEVSRLSHAALQRYNGGDLVAARSLFQQLLQIDGENRDALYYLGVICGRQGDFVNARRLLDKIIASEPSFIDALNALANIEVLQERWRNAEDLYRRALELDPECVAIWCNLGLCLRAAGEFDAAESALCRAIELSPDCPEALLNLAMVVADMGRPAQARELLQRCLVIAPELAEAHTGLAHLLLQSGEFAAGWREYAWRFRCLDAERQPEYPVAHWDGQPIPGQTLLIRAEQGLGDQMMFASCLPDVIAQARTCLVECEPRLVGLFARSFPQARFFAHYPKREPQWQRQGLAPDYQTHLGNLPSLFRSKAGDFPRHDGYLCADPVRVAAWRRRLAGLGAGPKIGISWRGGAVRTRRNLRSVALAEWLPILRQTPAVFVSLQYGDCRGEIDALEESAGVTIHHWQEAIDDYDECAALTTALERVITVQTAIAHLAGALGKRTWVLVPASPEWRYMEQGEVMPWYPALMLLRQHRRNEWGPVIERLAALLASEIADACKSVIA